MSLEYRIDKITLETPPGEVLMRMQVKACYVALEHSVPVEFVHNDRLFRVAPAELTKQCVQIGTVKYEKASN